MNLARSLRGLVVRVPAAQRDRVKVVLRRSFLGSTVLRWYSRNVLDAYIVSFPKCGRTWLRLLIGKALSLHFGLDFDDDELIDLEKVTRRIGVDRVPIIGTTHDDRPQRKAPAELSEDKSAYAGKKVVLVIRDLRDVFVSSYFHGTKRSGSLPKDMTFSEYLNFERGGCDTFVRFHNIWWKNRKVPAEFLIVRYEDLHRDTGKELTRVLDFLGIRDVSDADLSAAIEYASFESLQKKETGHAFESDKMRPGKEGDPESLKIRKGKVGGYSNYLDADQIAHLDAKLGELDPGYGYSV